MGDIIDRQRELRADGGSEDPSDEGQGSDKKDSKPEGDSSGDSLMGRLGLGTGLFGRGSDTSDDISESEGGSYEFDVSLESQSQASQKIRESVQEAAERSRVDGRNRAQFRQTLGSKLDPALESVEADIDEMNQGLDDNSEWSTKKTSSEYVDSDRPFSSVLRDQSDQVEDLQEDISKYSSMLGGLKGSLENSISDIEDQADSGRNAVLESDTITADVANDLRGHLDEGEEGRRKQEASDKFEHISDVSQSLTDAEDERDSILSDMRDSYNEYADDVESFVQEAAAELYDTVAKLELWNGLVEDVDEALGDSKEGRIESLGLLGDYVPELKEDVNEVIEVTSEYASDLYHEVSSALDEMEDVEEVLPDAYEDRNKRYEEVKDQLDRRFTEFDEVNSFDDIDQAIQTYDETLDFDYMDAAERQVFQTKESVKDIYFDEEGVRE